MPETYRMDDLEVTLQSLPFTLKRDDGRVAVYEGVRRDPTVPQAPVYALRVTLASPGEDPEAKKEVERFLKGLLVGFVLTEPKPYEQARDDKEPEPALDVDSEVLFEFRLVDVETGDGPVGVTAVARAMIAATKTVLKTKEHRWKAQGGLSTATVTPKDAMGWTRKPTKAIAAGQPSRLLENRKDVWVGTKNRFVYYFAGSFTGPH